MDVSPAIIDSLQVAEASRKSGRRNWKGRLSWARRGAVPMQVGRASTDGARRPRYTPGARRRPEAEQFASGHLDRRAPRFRIGPECATQTVAARRCRRFRGGRADAPAQRNFTAARAESLNYFGERTIGLP